MLIDSRASDARACLAVLDGREVTEQVGQAAELLATVVGQDLEQTEDGIFRIVRRVAKDRVISTVDPQARHGHKTSARGFDGYKGHIAADPDSEIITHTKVSAANVGDASVAADLINDLTTTDSATDSDGGSGSDGGGERPRVYGDAAYGSGEFLDHLAANDIDSSCKTQPPRAPGGQFTKDRFDIDLASDTVTCPAGATAPIRRDGDGGGIASFAGACTDCPLRSECTTAAAGRTITISRHEQHLSEARAQQKDPAWAGDYRATRPKVERKIGHLMRRRHGGRRARMRGQPKIDADFNLLAAAHNLARLAVLGLRSHPTNGWATAA